MSGDARHLVADVGALEPVVRLIGSAQRHAPLGVMPHLPQGVEEPVDQSLDVVLSAFRLDESLKVVVSVALGRHRPELANDRDLGLCAEPIDLDRFQEFSAAPECA
jgi:hypothetical protein